MTIQVDAAQGQFNEKNTAALNKVTSLFDSTLTAFKAGGKVLGGNEKPVLLNQLTDTVAIKSVDQAL